MAGQKLGFWAFPKIFFLKDAFLEKSLVLEGLVSKRTLSYLEKLAFGRVGRAIVKANRFSPRSLPKPKTFFLAVGKNVFQVLLSKHQLLPSKQLFSFEQNCFTEIFLFLRLSRTQFFLPKNRFSRKTICARSTKNPQNFGNPP